MTDAKKAEQKKEMRFNPVQLSTIHKESILKERRYEGKNFKYDYTFQLNSCKNNKYKLIYLYTVLFTL